jgi:N-acetylmuramoyl-L-alanine amidase CwlA
MILITPAFSDYKADAPMDYKEKARRENGSIFDAFGKRTSSYKGKLTPQKANEKKNLSKKERLWNASLEYVSNFQLSFLSKNEGKIMTDPTKIPELDSTGVCYYGITIKILNDGDIMVSISSKQDSPIRLRAFEKLVQQEISLRAKNA